MWSSVDRVIGEDTHGAVAASVVGGVLYLTEANGVESRYALNGIGQLVKVHLSGGGTAVLAIGVTTVQFSIIAGLLNLEVQFHDGESNQATFGGIQPF